MTTPNEIFEESKRKEEAFREQLQRDAQREVEIIELTASKLADKIIDKNSFFKSSEFEQELLATIKKIASSDIIDRILDHMKCPMLTKPNWGYCTGCEKGKEEWCDSIKFLECPAFSQYRAHELVEGPKRKLAKSKVAKKKKPARKKK